MKILILGVNGFIGNALVKRILETRDWEVFGMDLFSNKIAECLGNPRFRFLEGDIAINKEWIEYHIKKCDVALPLGPIHKQRGIYSCSKQLLDRVIWAYGEAGRLQFSMIRPFNWIGPKLDDLYAAKEGSSRVVTQFILNLIQGEPIRLVDGGYQKRCFTYVEDGIDCLMDVIENPGGVADGQIFNIGNPANEASVKELAHMFRGVF